MRRFASKRQRVQVFILQDGLCSICGGELGKSFQVDHLVPYSRGGETELWNLQALCQFCHSEKTSAAASERR